MRQLLMMVVLAGCGPRLHEDEVGGLRRLQGTIRAGSDGRAELPLDPLDGEVAALVTALARDDARVHVFDVRDAGDGVLFDAVDEATGDRATTNAGYLSAVSTLNWPRSASDALQPLTITYGNASAQNKYTRGKIDVTALFKEDADLSQGTLPVALVYAGGTDGDAELVAAVDEAVAQWRVLYDAIGLSLDIAETTFPDGDLGLPVTADEPRFVEIAEATGPVAVNVVLVPEVVGISTGENVLGIAGDIPGPLAATARSAVLVSALQSAGPDGQFDVLETRLLAETLAHEVGHYLGLFHPVEVTWDRYDALDDTPECQNESGCIDKLKTNLMFPFPVCTFATCTPQDDITSDQADVAQRYTGVGPFPR